ncbi:hypothetical protein K493DRAFT_300799 [Basidiobolus meristosporus CBS 931.73]|uniref:Uncharacterized protein n=1 Tax=Basidiobolus meristosporus CBS 931.73 TaxID=1314790 RepID=A0A1Y1YFA2_9FUNG|nr:hypothetical protein K493DRAFT_300799 [Basidiobolus meristosporus CBS 931.73]|eukprot:ORX96657.1 hypothetical protein K493DRAFT_300799 [Basidiobolus meristosporus CBS 931.73]
MEHCILHSLPTEIFDRILLLTGKPAELFHLLSKTDKAIFSRFLSSDAYWREAFKEWHGLSDDQFFGEPSRHLQLLGSPLVPPTYNPTTLTSLWYQKYCNHERIPYLWARKRLISTQMDPVDNSWTYVSNSEWDLIRWKMGLFQVLDPLTRAFATHQLPDDKASIVKVTIQGSLIVLEAERRHLRNRLMFYVWCSEKQGFVFPMVDKPMSHELDETSNYKLITCQHPYMVIQRIPMGALSSEYQIWNLSTLASPVLIPTTQLTTQPRPFINMYLFFYLGILEELDEFKGVAIHPKLPWFLTLSRSNAQLWKYREGNRPKLSHYGNVEPWKETELPWAVSRDYSPTTEVASWEPEREYISAHLLGDKACLLYASLPTDHKVPRVTYYIFIYQLPPFDDGHTDTTGNLQHRIQIEVAQTSKLREHHVIEMANLNLIVISYRDDTKLKFILVNTNTLQVTMNLNVDINCRDTIHIRKLTKRLNFLLVWTTGGDFFVIDVWNPSLLGCFSTEPTSTVVSTTNLSFVLQLENRVAKEYLLNFS